jgi:hypothetical protein
MTKLRQNVLVMKNIFWCFDAKFYYGQKSFILFIDDLDIQHPCLNNTNL